jgi:hypothetical protein
VNDASPGGYAMHDHRSPLELLDVPDEIAFFFSVQELRSVDQAFR